MTSALEDSRKVVRYIWTHPANRRHRVASLARATAFQLRARLTGRPALTPIGEHNRMWVHLHQHGASKVLYANPPDWPEMQAWKALLGPGDLFVDVGSNAGTYSLWAAEAGARVIAVEPDPGAVERLRHNIALNDLQDQIEVQQCALAAEPGRLRLTSGRDTTNHLLPPDEESGTLVEVRTLDELLGDDRAAGIKIDVEGAERMVLAGAARALREHRIDVLQLEWNEQSELLFGETRAPLADLLRGHGYHLLRPDDQGRLRPTDASGYGADLFAVRPGLR
ncbi:MULTISPECIES: FkbM family methyltransferase [Micromonospora]|uniref:Methyltransferase, FkbM family n=1 Tax=Micromonospora yangpuensis TaxID=683228 RepID=A0A1C6UGU1_9ACTN|nr:FkbM family methyltransferase [Micromonospora yangpuensis]GGM04697.1 methyltransferase FkbM [Micromonospora yangpuensis]SCL53178.1 methyltransferase, FkbM family [Micromonospora yangpuensis]